MEFQKFLRLDEYESKKPITAYAISKWDAEQHITSLGNENFHVSVWTALFGSSPNSNQILF